MEENGDWHEWIEYTEENTTFLREEITLQIHQPVRCKINVTANKKCMYSVELYNYERPNAFTIIEGVPFREEIRHKINTSTGRILWMEPGDSTEDQWVFRINEEWTYSRAPLSGHCRVSPPKMDIDDYTIKRNFAFIYVDNSVWTGVQYIAQGETSSPNSDQQNPQGTSNDTPGFEFNTLGLVFILMLIIIKKRKER